MKKMKIILVHAAPTRSGHNFLRFNLCSWLKIDPRVDYWNYEGISPSGFLERFNKDYRAFEKIANRKKLHIPYMVPILTNRDLLDWLASIYKQTENAGREHTIVNLDNWHSTTREIMKPGISHDFDFRFTYDEFISSEEFRRDLCEQMNGKYNEDYLNFVPKANKGSSFDKLTHQDHGSSMKTTERYLEYTNNETYKENLRMYPEVLYTYGYAYKPSPEKVAFVKSLNI